MRLWLAWIAVALLAAPAAAGEDRDAAALHHLDVGVAAYRAGDYAAARREFDAARRLVPDKANPYRWLGLADAQLGDCAQALLELETFLKRVPADDERVPEVTRRRDQCQRPPGPPPVAAPSSVTPPSSALAPASALAPSTTPPSAAVAPPSSEAATRRPLARRWWFWTALGGAAAIAATGVTLGIVLATPHESRLPPIVCGTTGCASAP
jgi:tetratricopeptide (TPR) repeat protein